MPSGVYKRTKSYREKLSKLCKGRKPSEETKRKMSLAHKGNNRGFKKGDIPWNKGKKCERFILLNKQRIGKKLTKQHRRNISESLRGKKHGWEKTGEEHWNWKGGKSFEPYSVDWTKTLRQSIRERDHYTCKICGEKQGDRAFSVHHIDYNKLNCNLDNLITLCTSCHTKTNKNRDYWIKYFKNYE